MSAESFATDLRDAVQALMEADPFYAPIEIVSERLKDLEEKINETVATAGGIAILLVTPSFENVLTDVRGAHFDDVKMVARVLENTRSNDTGLAALDVAIHTAALWSQLKPDALANPLKLQSVVLGNDPRFLAWDVTASTSGGTALDIPRLADVGLGDPPGKPPVMDGSVSKVLTHPTPGAVIFYTLDGSAAVPRNPSAAVFTTAFTAPSGTTLRARAWLPGFIPSPEFRVTL